MKHIAPLHAKPLHGDIDWELHAPVPLHVEASETTPFEQVCDAHVSVPEYVHIGSTPSQLPWHAPVPEHAAREPCGWPAATVWQVPCCPEMSHAWQESPHAPQQ